jgi:hypothetical protein
MLCQQHKHVRQHMSHQHEEGEGWVGHPLGLQLSKLIGHHEHAPRTDGGILLTVA